MSRRERPRPPRARLPEVRGLRVVEDYKPVRPCETRDDLIRAGLLTPAHDAVERKPRRGEG